MTQHFHNTLIILLYFFFKLERIDNATVLKILWLHQDVLTFFTQKNVMFMTFWQQIISSRLLQIVIGSNLNLQMKLLFCPPITCSNLLLIICCENVMDITFFCVKNVKTSWCRHNIFKIAELSILYKLK